MKPRKVIVMMELETDMSIKALTNKDSWECYSNKGSLQQIKQIQANVVKEKGGKWNLKIIRFRHTIPTYIGR